MIKGTITPARVNGAMPSMSGLMTDVDSGEFLFSPYRMRGCGSDFDMSTGGCLTTLERLYFWTGNTKADFARVRLGVGAAALPRSTTEEIWYFSNVPRRHRCRKKEGDDETRGFQAASGKKAKEASRGRVPSLPPADGSYM